MVLKIIERANIDTNKWDSLVTSKVNQSIFSQSIYLDVVSEKWCVITNEDYSCGIAVPYTVRLGIKCFTTPIFVRYLEWFGQKENWNYAQELIEKNFSGGAFHVTENLVSNQNLRCYQVINEERKLGTQAKRMLSKSKHVIIEFGEDSDITQILNIIATELPGKISTLNKHNIELLKILVHSLTQKGYVKSLVIKNEQTVVAGILLIEFNGILLYLKGASLPEYKKMGAMYQLMHHAIEYAQQKGLQFDFGGSSAEGVRRFNLNLGGVDKVYGVFHSDKAPLWFKELKRLKNLWTKK
jgi:hypothetical protein